MQVERESGGDLARAFFDEDPEDERVVTISFFLISCFGVVELPLSRARALKEWCKYLNALVGEF